jgi:(5-formylfuran-3-yl)methyl phosphate synthase
MTGLLVSVRSAAEARIALAGGADIIDVKEPRRGALGPADPIVWTEILEAVGSRAPVSAALGELHSDEIRGYAACATGFTYAKAGLSDWQRWPDLAKKWLEIERALPPPVRAVPVVYADIDSTGSKTFEAAARSAIEIARASQSGLLVIDTFHKNCGNLLDLVTIQTLQNLSHAAASQRVRLVLAGSLNERAIDKLLPLNPAYIGVRGAACAGGRDGTIQLGCVKSLAQLVHRQRQKAAS